MQIRQHYFTFLFLLLPGLLAAQEEDNIQVEASYQKEIKALTSHPAVKRALALIKRTDEQTVQETIKLTEIPAPPFKEEVRAEAFKNMLVEIGVDSAWIDAEGNVIALRKGTKGDRTVALDAHLDTVFPEETDVSVTVKGDTLFAPGVGDDSRGLAIMLSVLRAMNETKLQTEDDVLFIGTVGEEGLGDLRGVKYLFGENGPGIDSWISIDGGDLGAINCKGLGSYRYLVTFEGPGGHSWGAFGLANPHHALGAAIRYFVEAADKYTETGPRTSYNIGRIGGGTSVNSIPFTSWMEIDTRSVEPSRLDDLKVILEEAMQRGLKEQNELRRGGRELTVTIEMIGNRPSGELSPELPLIQRAMAALGPFDKQPHLRRGSTNSNIPISLGIPAVTIGRGGVGGRAHSLLEWWANKDGYEGVQYALLVLLAESGLAKR
ncbi:M20/M25/M40 family metallo-hydrolase [Flavilitoribacter nigricans]|uniref:Peptidase M20 n=1 Tax=Flavilitoribacter nigricans (strain ATCC 23147 / DSM 23189 / NBRC 102662 / NCIMB 1420 / SS-2) TaxID=1122177 RepID=A0A2D0NAJ4_FLAN2|nr:M20/M25/M40 family metallo-hydrolase [Flavilitoribacter nigricans]PHN05189.1 peptidase M20 [Flavilitoribacter nigricans DSM 23189 = NBRC 102662]